MIFSVLLPVVAAHLTAQSHPPKTVKPKSTAPASAKVDAKPVNASTGYLPDAPQPSTVLAKVNGVPIRASDVDKLLWDWAGRGIMEDLILFQLIRDRAKADKITASPQDITKAFDEQMIQIQSQVPPGQDLDAFIREKGYPKSRLYLHIQADILMTKIVDLKFKKSDYISVSTLLVTPKGQALPGTRPDPGATPPPPPTPQDKQEAAGKAMDLYNRLKKGEDWDKVLASTNQTPQTIQNHGALGWRAVAAFPPLTQFEFKTLKIHEYTKPIETPNGFQIFRVDGFGVNADTASLENLKKEYEARAKQSLAQELQKGAKIEKLFGVVAKAPQLQKLGIEDKKVGTGQPVANGDEVFVIYTGKFKDGRVFDSNAKPGANPFHFVVGSGEVIKGWDLGLVGMRKGGQRKLSVPYSLAYGDRGNTAIPPQTDIYFDVEVKDIVKPKATVPVKPTDVKAGKGR